MPISCILTSFQVPPTSARQISSVFPFWSRLGSVNILNYYICGSSIFNRSISSTAIYVVLLFLILIFVMIWDMYWIGIGFNLRKQGNTTWSTKEKKGVQMLAWQIIALMNVERMSLSCHSLPIADITRLRSRSRTIVIVIYIYTSDDIFAWFLIPDDIIWFVCHFPLYCLKTSSGQPI